MRMFSDTAWDIASRYSDVLASETRDLAAAIDAIFPKWQPIETAPKDGTEILGWREDCDVLLMRWGEAAEFMTDSELERDGDGEWEHEPGWFYADFVSGGRLQDDEQPTLWARIVPPESENESE